MNRPQRALLLIGSPKGGHSTSKVLGEELLARLRARGLQTESVPVSEVAACREDFEKFLLLVEKTDLLLLAFPLYADSLPAITTRALEWIAERRTGRKAARPQGFAAIGNCGFPEASQIDTALAICRCFAGQAGFHWAGGLAMGAGGALAGRSLDALGGMMRRVREALDMAAAALAEGAGIPPEAAVLMARPIMPARVYLSMGTLGFKRKAKRQGVLERLGDTPYGE